MGNVIANIKLDLRADDVQPVQRFAALLLSVAIWDRAERIDIRLEDISSDSGLRIAVSAGDLQEEKHSPPGHLFQPLVVVYCNYAGIAYYSKGSIEGTIETQHPRSTWRLQSDDLSRAIALVRVSPIPPINQYRPIDCGR